MSMCSCVSLESTPKFRTADDGTTLLDWLGSCEALGTLGIESGTVYRETFDGDPDLFGWDVISGAPTVQDRAWVLPPNPEGVPGTYNMAYGPVFGAVTVVCVDLSLTHAAETDNRFVVGIRGPLVGTTIITSAPDGLSRLHSFDEVTGTYVDEESFPWSTGTQSQRILLVTGPEFLYAELHREGTPTVSLSARVAGIAGRISVETHECEHEVRIDTITAGVPNAALLEAMHSFR